MNLLFNARSATELSKLAKCIKIIMSLWKGMLRERAQIKQLNNNMTTVNQEIKRTCEMRPWLVIEKHKQGYALYMWSTSMISNWENKQGYVLYMWSTSMISNWENKQGYVLYMWSTSIISNWENKQGYVQGLYAAWKSLNSMEFHLLKIKALKAWNLIN